MDPQRQLTWQMTIIMSLSIIIFGGGTMALLIQGKDVPGALWAIVGGLVNAIITIAGFFNMRQMHVATLWHLAQVSNTGVGNISIPTSGTTTVTTTEQPNSGVKENTSE